MKKIIRSILGSMNDRKAFTLINIIRNIITIYFDTFFAIYFFNLTNYEILPLAKYYLIVYLMITISFWFLRKCTALKYKVYYYRISISFLALYLALIMLLKEKIVSHIYLVAFIKGLSEGFYYYPRNILNSSKISNIERGHYDGIVNAINQVSSIIIPLLLGILLTYFSYVEIGKAVFVLVIVIFILSYYVKDDGNTKDKVKTITFLKKIWKNTKIKNALIIQFLKGFTISSGVLTAAMTIYKILYFESNLYIGILNSFLGLLTCIFCIIYAKKSNSSFKMVNIITYVLITLSMISLCIKPNNYFFIIYLIIYATGVTLISLKSDNITVNASNHYLIIFHKAEYHMLLETFLGISRVGGYVILLIIGLIGKEILLKYILLFSIIPLGLLIFYLNKYEKK